ncbi:hypothetical protein C0J52_21032 [Blattella germanica]|nr:hypothetical protein C0J52_21032 [Blattella germanica]
MFIFKIILFSLLVIGIKSQKTQAPCRTWCMMPYVYSWEQLRYYCCDNQVKDGNCPPIRSMCPVITALSSRRTTTHLSPVVCQNDGNCAGTDKCCYDVCIMHYTCKPAE